MQIKIAHTFNLHNTSIIYIWLTQNAKKKGNKTKNKNKKTQNINLEIFIYQ